MDLEASSSACGCPSRTSIKQALGNARVGWLGHGVMAMMVSARPGQGCPPRTYVPCTGGTFGFLGPPPLPNSAAAMPGPKTLMQLKAMQLLQICNVSAARYGVHFAEHGTAL